MIKLFPMFRIFRCKVEEHEVPLEESVPRLVDAAYLVWAKARMLVPAVDAPEEEEESELIAEEIEIEPVMDLAKAREIARVIEDRIRLYSVRFGRGMPYVPPASGDPDSYSIDVSKLRSIMDEFLRERAPRKIDIPVVKIDFLAHVRWFWREVRRMASEKMVIAFSRFPWRSRKDEVLSFLALMELIRRHRVKAWQEEMPGDILFSTRSFDEYKKRRDAK